LCTLDPILQGQKWKTSSGYDAAITSASELGLATAKRALVVQWNEDPVKKRDIVKTQIYEMCEKFGLIIIACTCAYAQICSVCINMNVEMLRSRLTYDVDVIYTTGVQLVLLEWLHLSKAPLSVVVLVLHALWAAAFVAMSVFRFHFALDLPMHIFEKKGGVGFVLLCYGGIGVGAFLLGVFYMGWIAARDDWLEWEPESICCTCAPRVQVRKGMSTHRGDTQFRHQGESSCPDLTSPPEPGAKVGNTVQVI
jgi:hypothetical protein